MQERIYSRASSSARAFKFGPAKMLGMAVQFSTRTILLATAFIAVSLGSAIVLIDSDSTPNRRTTVDDIVWVGAAFITIFPLFNPLIWAAYAIGRRQFTTKFVFAFTVFQAAITALVIGTMVG